MPTTKRLPRTALLPVIACLAPALLSAAGCGAPPPPEVPAAKAPEKPKMRAPVDLPSRIIAVDRDRAGTIGQVGSARLYTVAGERWSVGPGGETAREASPLGDTLLHVAPFGRGGLSALGWNNQAAYTFEDVLGAPKTAVQSSAPFTSVRPGPNALLLFTLFSATAIDLSTGLEKGSFFPPFPARDAVFVDDLRGVVATAVGGIGTTIDGGKTWRPVRHPARIVPTLHLVQLGDSIHLQEIYSNRLAKIDLDRSEIADWAPFPGVDERPKAPIERFLGAYGNPLTSAVVNGIDAGQKTGIVGWDGVVARVDLATGVFTETVEIGSVGAECRGAMSGKDAYLVCGAKDRKGKGETLWRVKTQGKLVVEEVPGGVFGGPGNADIAGSDAGGLMVFHGCGAEWVGYCVRQPDGAFSHVPREMVPYSDLVPLADGRIANVGVRPATAETTIQLVASTAKNKRVLEEMHIDDSVTVTTSRPSEGVDGVIRFLVAEQPAGKADPFHYLYAYEPGKRGFRKTALPDGVDVRFGDGVLVAVTKDRSRVTVSHDHGVTWKEVEMPAGSARALRTITRLGMITSSHTRVGWGPLPAAASVPKPEPSLRLQAGPPPPKATTEIVCRTEGASKTGSPVPRFASDVAVALGQKPAPKDVSRVSLTYTGQVLDPTVLLDIDAKPVKGSTQTASVAWTLRWVDPTEPSPKVRTATAKGSPEAARAVTGAWAREGTLLFAIDARTRQIVARTKGTGVETAVVDASLFPAAGSPAGISADGSVIAYLAGGNLVVWKSGDAPRPIAVVNQRIGVAIGVPTKEGVPLLADVEGQSYYRVFPLPADKAPPEPQDEPVSTPWDGWTRSVSLLGGRGPVSFCAAKAPGNVFRGTSYAGQLFAHFTLDDRVPTATPALRWEAVSDGQTLCLRSVTAFLSGGVSLTQKTPGGEKRVDGLDLLRFAPGGKKSELSRFARSEKPPILTATCTAGAAAK